MANTPISGFTSGAPAQSGDEFVIARSGANYKLTAANLATYIGANGAAGSSGQVQYNNGGAFGGLSQLTYSGGMINVVSAPFGLSGNISSTAWTTSGIRYKNSAATLTDTSSTGTVATAYTDLFGGNTIAASNSTTFTNYYTSWINAPTAGANVAFTGKWALGLGGALDVQAGTVTTNTTPALNLSQTWNAGAVTFTGLKFNATDTASASGSLLLDLQVGGTSQLSVSKSGLITVATVGGAGIRRADGGGIQINGTALLTFENGRFNTLSSFRFGSTSAQLFWNDDTYLSRGGTATLQLGAADVASGAVAQTLQVQSNTGAGQSGQNFTIKGSAGPAGGGSIIFQTAATTSYATALTIDGARVATLYQSSGNADITQLTGSSLIFESGSSQTKVVFSFGGVGKGGIRADSSGNFNWHATGSQGHQFYSGSGDNQAFSGSGLAVNCQAGGTTAISGISLFGSIGFRGGSNTSNANDVILTRDAANTLALKNSTNPQIFRAYSTTTGPNYGYIAAGVTDAGVATADTLFLGTGGAGAAMTKLAFVVNGTTRADYNSTTAGVWTFSAAPSAQYVPGYAFSHSYAGAFGYNALATFYAGSTSNNSTIYFSFGHSSAANNSASIGLQFVSSGSSSNYLNFSISGANNLLNIFPSGLVAFSGTTSSFPALKRISSGNALQVIAADNTASAGFIVGNQALATTATDGFLYIPTCAGTPTGTPTTQTGTAPLVVDSTNNKLYVYVGGAWTAMN